MSQVSVIKQVIKDQAASEPGEGTIYAINGERVDVRVRGSATLLKDISVAGSTGSLQVGQVVTLKWEYGRPIALAVPGTGFVPLVVKIAADNDTIENAAQGIRVKARGIRPWHLSFRPSVEGHTHLDMLQLAGWVIDENGDISNADVYLHTDGQISLGNGTNVLKLDAQHATHRLWIGNNTPGDADFSVDKAGKVTARSGSIGGWDILSDRLSKNGAELRASGELTLGSGGDSAVLSAVDPDGWKLWLGADNPEEAPFRVKGTGEVFLENANINSNIRSGNYQAGSQGWAIDQAGRAEFNDVTIRGTMSSVVFASATTSIMGSRTVISDGGALISDVGNSDDFIAVDTSVFAMGDMLVLSASPARSEWMQVTVAPEAVSGGYRYGVQRDLAGKGACVFFAGETVASKGTSILPDSASMIGEFDELGSFTMGMVSSTMAGNLGGFLTLEGGRAYGPYFGVARRFGPAYNQISDILRIGRLTGFLGITENKYGFATGDINRHMTYTDEDGLSIVTNGGATAINDNGVTTDALNMGIVSTPPAYQDQFGRLYLDHATRSLRLRCKDGSTQFDTAVGSGGVVTGSSGPLQRKRTSDLALVDGEYLRLADYLDLGDCTLSMDGDALLEIL